MIQTGLMAEAYGKTPAELMDADHLAPIEAWHFNSDILQATAQFKKDRREAQRQGGGSIEDQRDLVSDQINRQDTEQQDPSDQMQNLQSVKDHRVSDEAPSGSKPDADIPPADPSMHTLGVNGNDG